MVTWVFIGPTEWGQKNTQKRFLDKYLSKIRRLQPKGFGGIFLTDFFESEVLRYQAGGGAQAPEETQVAVHAAGFPVQSHG